MQVNNLQPDRGRSETIMVGPIPTFSLWCEADTGLIRVVGVGVWTAAACDRHFAEVERMVLAARRAPRPVRLLVDLRRSGEQDERTTERIGHWTRQIYTAEDRVAMLVESTLLKAQMRRRLDGGRHAMFVSEAAARLWLFAYDEAAPTS
jgi:hypothetical protein